MSTYAAPVIELVPETHPEADLLKIVRVKSWTVCIRTADWINEDGSLKHKKAAYIEPDTLVPLQREEFKWLITSGLAKEGDTQYRVKAKRLRKVPSFGFLIPVPDDIPVDTNMWDELQLERWQPPEPADNGQSVKAPRRDFAKYDIENIKNYEFFTEGEEVYIFEKIHGQNMRTSFQEDQIYVGSRSLWKADCEGSDFWKSFRSVPGLKTLVTENPHLCIFGESYGNVGGFPYDCQPGERKFAAFDIFDMNELRWFNPAELLDICKKYDVPTAPLLYHGAFSMAKALELAEGKSTLNKNHVREGVVVSPAIDRRCGIGHGQRCKLKCVGLGYLEKS